MRMFTVSIESRVLGWPVDSCHVAPAVSAIKYKNLASTAGLEKDVSPYQGPPSDLNNQLWSDLYNCEWLSSPIAAGLTINCSRDVEVIDNRGAPASQ